MKALILAGGFGTRLKKIIPDIPKVMVPINGRPFLEYVLRNLKSMGITEVIVSVGYLSQTVSDYFGKGSRLGMHIVYSMENRPLGTGGGIKLAQKYVVSEPVFLTINGDTYTKVHLETFLTFHIKHHKTASILLSPNGEKSNSGNLSLRQTTGKVITFQEKSHTSAGAFINSGYYLFDPRIFTFIPEKQTVSLEKEVFPKLILAGQLYGFIHASSFYDIGLPKGYKKAQRLLPAQL